MYHSENGENRDIKQKRKSSEIGARQTKIAYDNSETVKRLHGLVFENNFFFLS